MTLNADQAGLLRESLQRLDAAERDLRTDSAAMESDAEVSALVGRGEEYLQARRNHDELVSGLS